MQSSLVPRPLPDFISQLWRQLRDKIWEWPGDEGRQLRDKIWEWPRDEATCRGVEALQFNMDRLSMDQLHAIIKWNNCVPLSMDQLHVIIKWNNCMPLSMDQLHVTINGSTAWHYQQIDCMSLLMDQLHANIKPKPRTQDEQSIQLKSFKVVSMQIYYS